ncbi:MAG: RNA 3'-terminal phosphate cyclase [Thaumarchaeota archaeon]|nr:RNA 3'-terminal phosphate cyclase [Nitrososphaerota archaeon]
MEFLEVDGSRGEGWGQILRTAIAFSVIMNKKVRVSNVRAGREVPGLKRQHVSALRTLSQVFDSELRGATEGSSEVSFAPGSARVTSLVVDMGTAASITLVLQAVIPAVSLSRKGLRLEIIGGTDVPWSPTFDYFDSVARGAYAAAGILFDAKAKKRGYYPRGGGRAVVAIESSEGVKPLDLVASPRIKEVNVASRCGSLPRGVAERQMTAAASVLERGGLFVKSKEVSEEDSESPGSSIAIHAVSPGAFVGADGLGARGKPAETVGEEAASKFLASMRSGGCLDPNVADMVVPLLSLAKGPSRVRVEIVTPHLESGLELAKVFTGCGYSVLEEGFSSVVTVKPRGR